MKEVTRIHLAKTPYDIEVEARKTLQKYLLDIEKTLQADTDTMTEIEARIVELLTEAGVTKDKVITAADIADVQQKLGAPDEFVDTEDVTLQSQGERRLMRDTSDGILGGVLAGIAAYYSVNVLWLRLAAIILGMVSFGTAFIVYLILWVIMPATKTVADKLQLYGQKVTPSEIKRHIEEFTHEETRTKPFVIVLRAGLALLWIGMALSAFVILGIGLVPGITSFDHIATEPLSGWLMAMWALGILSAVLFVIFCSVLAYASATWRMNKRLVVAIVILMVAGIMAFSGMVASGIVRNHQLNTIIAENTHRETIAVGDTLNGATSLKIEGSDATVAYVVSDKKSMQVTSIDSKEARDVSLTSDKGVVKLALSDHDEACSEVNRYCSKENLKVTIYGPALTSIDIPAETDVTYSAAGQDTLKLTTADASQFTLAEGRIANLDIISKPSSSVDVTEAAVRHVTIVTADNTSLYLGNIDTLAVNGQSACSRNGAAAIEVQSLNELRYNDETMTHGLTDKCVTVTVNDEEEL